MHSQSDRNDGAAYFLYHSIGQYPGKAEESARGLAEFCQIWGANDDAQWGAALSTRQEFIDGWRALINAPQGTLTTAENVTASLYTLIGSLPADHLKGKRVLVAQDCFPSLQFMLSGIAERFGFTLDTVALRQGATWVEDEDFVASWGPDVGLALLTWVTSTSSHRGDLQTLVSHGRQMGSMIGVDITQAVGLLAYDVMDPLVDFTVSTSLKWLCGTPGAGILHVARPLQMVCEPNPRGWFSQSDPFSWDLDKFSYAPDSRRFDNGTPSIMASVASLPALVWHAKQDRAAMLAHNRELTQSMIDMVDAVGLELVTPRAEQKRGGSIMIRLGSGVSTADLLDQMRENYCFADARGQILRLSPGTVTTAEGVENLARFLTRVCNS